MVKETVTFSAKAIIKSDISAYSTNNKGALKFDGIQVSVTVASDHPIRSVGALQVAPTMMEMGLSSGHTVDFRRASISLPAKTSISSPQGSSLTYTSKLSAGSIPKYLPISLKVAMNFTQNRDAGLVIRQSPLIHTQNLVR